VSTRELIDKEVDEPFNGAELKRVGDQASSDA
jgi:hypothetical protein